MIICTKVDKFKKPRAALLIIICCNVNKFENSYTIAYNDCSDVNKFKNPDTVACHNLSNVNKFKNHYTVAYNHPFKASVVSHHAPKDNMPLHCIA